MVDGTIKQQQQQQRQLLFVSHRFPPNAEIPLAVTPASWDLDPNSTSPETMQR